MPSVPRCPISVSYTHLRALPGEQVVGALEQHVDGALGKEGGDAVDIVESAHELAVGIEGQLAQPGVLGAVGLLVHAELFSQLHQGHLGGIADGGTGLLIVGGVAGQQSGLQQQPLYVVDQVQVCLLYTSRCV